MNIQTLLDDGHQDIHGHGDPDLRLDRVLGCAAESLDAQVLLDPLEEQFHAPACLVQLGDDQRRQRCVVGQEYQAFAGFQIHVPNSPECLRVFLGTVESGEDDDMIGQKAGRLVHGTGVATPAPEVALGLGDEEG